MCHSLSPLLQRNLPLHSRLAPAQPIQPSQQPDVPCHLSVVSPPTHQPPPVPHGVQSYLGEDAVVSRYPQSLQLRSWSNSARALTAASRVLLHCGRHGLRRVAGCTPNPRPYRRRQILPTCASSTLLGLKPNFNKSPTSTSTTRPPLHSALCSLPVLCCDELANPSSSSCSYVQATRLAHFLDGAVPS